MVTKIYKLELMVVDSNDNNLTGIIAELENCSYAYTNVMRVKTAEIESWDDNHPLNKSETALQIFDSLFKDDVDQNHNSYVKALDQEIDFA